MRYLKVPGKWLDACGMGTEDKVFPVLWVNETTLPSGERVSFVTVAIERFGIKDYNWVVCKEWRGATLVEADGSPERGLPMGFGRPEIAKRATHG